MKKNFLAHPYLFALHPVLFLYVHNINQVSFTEALPALIGSAGLALAVLLVQRPLVKDAEKRALCASWFLVLFFSYGHFYALTKDWQFGGLDLNQDRYLIGLFLILWGPGVTLILRAAAASLRAWTRGANTAALVLVALSAAQIGLYNLRPENRAAAEPSGRTIDLAAKVTPVSGEEPLRDIYYFIFDWHASAANLREFYGYDNSAFTDWLAEKGFYVAAESFANYPRTGNSMPSSLNLDYLDPVAEKMGRESDNWKPLYAMLQRHRAWQFLKSKGYAYVHCGSWWEPTRRNPYADLNIGRPIPEFLSLVTETTFAQPVIARFNLYDKEMRHREAALSAFEELSKIPQMKEPTFTVAHILLPHPPFVFDREGRVVTDKVEEKDRKAAYVEQLIYTDTRIRELVEKLLSGSEVAPVIILQADEGPYPDRFGKDQERFDWSGATPEELSEKLGILNAYYFPGAGRTELYPSVTPVNSFRLLFNRYFGTDLPLLPDKNYVMRDGRRIYDFLDVTAKLRSRKLMV